MFTICFCASFCMLSLLIGPGSCIVRCSLLDDVSRSREVPLIDGEFEDCGLEEILDSDYAFDGLPPISKMAFDFTRAGSDHTDPVLNFLISPTANPNFVREVTFTGHDWAGNLPLVEHAFRKLHGLEKVHWEIHQPITDKILRSLEENNPNSKLYYSFNALDFHPIPSLANSSLLYSLKGDFSYGYQLNPEPLDFVFTALSNAPNIRELDLYLHEHGCEVGGNLWAFKLSTNPSVRFSPLEVLKLDGYDLDGRFDGRTTWAWQGTEDEWDSAWKEYLDGDDEDDIPPPSPERLENERTNLEYWMEVMDWSNLHTLHLSGPSTATLCRLRNPALPALKHLSINAASGRAATQDEILNFATNGIANPLHSISLSNMGAESGDQLLEALTSSPNLTQDLRHFSYGAGGENIFFLNETKLSHLIKKSPHLEHLDVNIPRDFNMSIPDEGLLNDILSTRTLNQLTLRFPSPDDQRLAPGSGGMDWAHVYSRASGMWDEEDPLINLDTVRRLFNDMGEEKKGLDLKDLEFYVGNWENRFRTNMLGNDPMRVAYWKCTVRKGCQGEQTRME